MHIEEKIREKVDRLIQTNQTGLHHTLGIQFQTVTRQVLTATMPVNSRTVQPMGYLHGGASVAMAETMISLGAILNIETEGQTAVGLEINANHLRPVAEGRQVTGTARPIHIGSTTQVWETRLTDEKDKLVCISRGTLAIIDIR